MARNESFALNTEQADTLVWAKGEVTPLIGKRAEIAFTKRDGSHRVIQGEVESIGGNGSDTAIVTVKTEQGPRSANLWAIKAVKPL